MKRSLARLQFAVLVFTIASLVLGFIGCSGTASPVAADVVLTVTKDSQTSTYTMSSLKSLAVTTGWGGLMSSTGNISGPYQYRGVALTDLLNAAGGITENNAVRVSAKDGYAMTLSYQQITEGKFTVLDSTTGKEVTPSSPPEVILAYEEDGKALDDTFGPLRLGILTSNSQVTDGHWWVKWVQKVEVIPVEQPWTFELEGAINENIDKATFESGAAIGCHGAKYTDDQGHAWEGIPLWLLIGRVDDTLSHGDGAYSDTLADQGYEVQLVASDGYMVKLTAAETKRNNNMLVAYKMDGGSLSDKDWPLRLVGSAVEKQRQIGGIVSLKLVFPGATPTATPTATTSPTPTPAGAIVLTLVKGSQTKTYTMAQLQALTVLSGYGGKKSSGGTITGPLPYRGVAITVLLNDAFGGITATEAAVVTAKDGYTKSIYGDVLSQGAFATYNAAGQPMNPTSTPVAFVAFEENGKAFDPTDNGPLMLCIMTDRNTVTDGSWWIKQVIRIEIVRLSDVG